MILKVKKDIKQAQGQWIVTIDSATWTKSLKKAEVKLINQLQVPGFRKGKVPNNIAKEHINEAAILKAASKNIINEAYEYALSQKPELEPSQKPTVEITKLSTTECEIIFKFDLSVEIKIGKYRDLKIVKETPIISKEEIEKQLQLLKDRFAIYTPKQEPLATGDIAIFAFEGSVDGKPFPGGSSENMELEIGSNKFIPGFEQEMLGMKPTEVKSFKIKFPEDYHVPFLKGEEVDFKITLHDIKIKTVNDDYQELVKDVNIANVKTYEQLLEHIEKKLLNEKTSFIKEKFMENLFYEIIKNSEIIIPNTAIKHEKERLEKEFKKQLDSQNFNFEDYKKMTGLTDKEIDAEIEKDAIEQLERYLIIHEIIKIEKIAVTKEEIENRLQLVAEELNMPITEIKEKIKDLDLITNGIQVNKAYELLWASNGIAAK